MITLRYRKRRDNRYNIYLDIYYKDRAGYVIRKRESLDLQVSRNYYKKSNILEADKEAVTQAQQIAKIKEQHIACEQYDVETPPEVQNKTMLMDMLQKRYRQLRKKSIKSTLYHLNNYLPQDVPLSAVSVVWLQDFEKYLLERVQQNSAKRYISILRGLFTTMEKAGSIKKNPFEKYQPPRKLSTNRDALTWEEVQQIKDCDFPLHEDTKRGFLFSCYTGLRYADIKALCFDDFDTMSYAGKRYYFLDIIPEKTRKQNKRLRVPLCKQAEALYREQLKNRQNGQELVFAKFANSHGAVSQQMTQLMIVSRVKKKLHFHLARHTFATLALNADISIFVVSKLLGHSRICTTEIYSQLSTQKKQQGIKKIPIFNGLERVQK